MFDGMKRTEIVVYVMVVIIFVLPILASLMIITWINLLDVIGRL